MYGILARYVRILPRAWSGYLSMRATLLLCRFSCPASPSMVCDCLFCIHHEICAHLNSSLLCCMPMIARLHFKVCFNMFELSYLFLCLSSCIFFNSNPAPTAYNLSWSSKHVCRTRNQKRYALDFQLVRLPMAGMSSAGDIMVLASLDMETPRKLARLLS